MSKTQEWFNEQRRTIGGSLAAATFGQHEFITPYEAYNVLTGGDVPDISNKPDIIRGNLLESVAALRLEQTLGIKLVHHPQDQFLYNPTYPYAHCLPDYYIEGQPIMAEIKVPNPHTWGKLEYEIPTYIQAQLFHQLAITGAEAICLVALNPVSMEIFRQIYTPDAEIIGLIMEAERKFWENHVVPRIPPQPLNENDLKLRWPLHISGKCAIATDGITEAHKQLVDLRAQRAHFDHLIADLNLGIKTHMENSEILIDATGRILATWKSHNQTALDGTRLKEDRPDVWKEFLKTKTIRTFLFKDR